MKKHLSLILALACTFSVVCAQPKGNEEIKASAGKAYVEAQGSYTPDFKIDGSNAKVKNVILLIGDGMGPGAVSSAMYANGGELTMTNLQTIGFVRTNSADNFTTDSAASGTAYATGEKTKNGYVGMNKDGEKIANIPEKLLEKGFVSGVVSTDDLSGATPAAFFAHQRSRHAFFEIWSDLSSAAIIFAAGGNTWSFDRLTLKTQDALRDNFTLVSSLDDEKIKDSDKLLYIDKMLNVAQRKDFLPKATEAAIEYLSERADKGFFLMVEGARIDLGGHNNDYQLLVDETLDFDKAVEAAIRFAEKDGHTLVIISADHETGAVNLMDGSPEDGFMKGSFASKGHSAVMVPLFAYGPRSYEFRGVQENSDVSNKIMSILTEKRSKRK